MVSSTIESLKIRAKLLQKSKKKLGKEIALKDAFTIIAKASGYSTWKELKDSYELADKLNPPHWSAQWKIWFSTKEEALEHLRDEQYLLPYRTQYFICDTNYLNALGLEADNKDLLKVGRDFSVPKDQAAWKRLLKSITVNS